MVDVAPAEDEFDYFTDIRAKEEELRRLNDELDLRHLDLTEENLAQEETPWINHGTPTINHNTSSTARIQARHKTSAKNVTYDSTRDARRDEARGATTKRQSLANENNRTGSGRKAMAARYKTSPNSSQLTSPQCTTDRACTANETPKAGETDCGGIGKNATIRLQKARIETLNSQLKEALRGKHEAEDGASKLRLQLRESLQEKKRLQKALSEAKSVAGKSRTDEEGTRTVVDDLKAELNQTKRELTSAQKSLRVAESEHKAREIRLSRALQEVEKYKESVAGSVNEKRQEDEAVRKEKEKMYAQVKSLERQRSELLNAFKKQLKLIDILKRQKVHAEAAKLLQITEEEFMKVIEWEA